MPVRRVISAAILAVVVWAVTSWWFELPPFEISPDQHKPVAEQYEVKAFPKKAPFRFGHRALAGICDEYSLNAETLIKEMKALGIDTRLEWSIKRIAEENDMEVLAVYDVLKQLNLQTN